MNRVVPVPRHHVKASWRERRHAGLTKTRSRTQLPEAHSKSKRRASTSRAKSCGTDMTYFGNLVCKQEIRRSSFRSQRRLAMLEQIVDFAASCQNFPENCVDLYRAGKRCLISGSWSRVEPQRDLPVLPVSRTPTRTTSSMWVKNHAFKVLRNLLRSENVVCLYCGKAMWAFSMDADNSAEVGNCMVSR